MEQADFTKSTICELEAAGSGQIIRLLRFSDSGFVNLTCDALCVNVDLDLGHQMQVAAMPNGTMRLSAIDPSKKNGQGDSMTLWWFDVELASWVFKHDHPVLRDVKSISFEDLSQ
ncbi:MAG: hypothetical protein ABJG42_24265 [Vibrio splendidus]